jgi:SAM-dependent methyltransferase
LWDEGSIRLVLDRLDLAGKRCLEVGAGGGEFAVQLADRVGADGIVVATDLDPGLIPEHPQIHRLRHNVVTDPIPGSGFDLIHARLLLNHLIEREDVFPRLVDSLAPGGWLLTEDICPRPADEFVADAPTAQDAALLTRYQQTTGRVLARHGLDPSWARRALRWMRSLGLADVDTEVRSRSWQGGSPGTVWMAATLAQTRAELLDAGMSGEDLDQVHLLLQDPGVVLHGHPMYASIGRRPPIPHH